MRKVSDYAVEISRCEVSSADLGMISTVIRKRAAHEHGERRTVGVRIRVEGAFWSAVSIYGPAAQAGPGPVEGARTDELDGSPC